MGTTSGGKAHLYTRNQGGVDRYYADLRGIGGGQVALKPDEGTRATSDHTTALKLLAEKITELEEGGAPKKRRARMTLSAFAKAFVKENPGGVTDRWLKATGKRLEKAQEFFGKDRELESIEAKDVRRWIKRLQATPNGRGGTYSGGTIRHHLHALSALYSAAAEAGHVRHRYNPVASLHRKPSASTERARWYEVHEAALLLESARTWSPPTGLEGAAEAIPFMYPLLATFLLTGGRRSEVLGLQVEDVNVERKVVLFRPNPSRPRLKTKGSERPVPLWPQLEEILAAYLEERPEVKGAGARLLFPSVKGSSTGMITDLRKSLDPIGERVGLKQPRTKIFRHTYATARLQTMDYGRPVSVWTVSRELGHESTSLVERTYGHLGEIRHRSEVVEYRVENHMGLIGEQVKKLREA